ncbi:11790_t:CDS:2, partial [Gigaspora margarita]
MADNQLAIDSLRVLEEHEIRITNLEQIAREQAELEVRIAKLELKLISKKNRKFQNKCIQIAMEILDEGPIIEYRPPFLNGLEFDAFFKKHRIALEVQGAQHRLHNTGWYKDVKKLEDIVNRDRLKRCMCQDNGIFLLEDNSPKVDLYCSVDKEGEHQTDTYWVFGSHCPLCRENHMSLQEPGIPYDDVLKAYSGNSELIQKLKTRCFTSPIPWNNVLILPDKSVRIISRGGITIIGLGGVTVICLGGGGVIGLRIVSLWGGGVITRRDGAIVSLGGG